MTDGATPYHALLSPIVSIKSNPVDVDENNDGVVDVNADMLRNCETDIRSDQKQKG